MFRITSPFVRKATRDVRFAAASMFIVVAAAHAQSDEPAAICTDRPTKSNAACTVDAGHLQYEADIANYTHLSQDGVTTDTYLLTNPTLKYGVTGTVDVELNIAPWEVVRTRDTFGNTSFLRGPSDTYARVKWKFYGDDQWVAALLPYVKAPTARHGIGNGALESGVLIPVSYTVNDKLQITSVPEFDSLKDGDNRGHHFNTSQLVSAAYSLPNNVTVYGELWGDWNVDPAKTVRQYSADIAIAWGITKTLQVDGGLNFGLNRATPSVQAYVGIAQRF